MNEESVKLLFALLRSAISGDPLQENEKAVFSDDILPELLSLSKKHDVAHLLILGLDINGLRSDGQTEIGHTLIKAVYRYEQLNFEYQNVCSALQTAQIPFIPLKGSVLRNYYPKPWMRTSCDIDILLHESDVEKAAAFLVENRGYFRKGRSPHDISLFSPAKKHIELHYDLVEDGLINQSAQVLQSVWETSTASEQNKLCYEMTDEMFYFYHIAHMAKHFEFGGCGIRPFIDLWILDQLETADQSKRDALLQRGDLMRFAEAARLLSRVWFSGAEHTEITKQMERYILRGGVYGTNENRIAVQQQKKGGRLQYAASKFFIPYDIIKYHYPILLKHRWLTPVMEVRRWCKLAFCGHAKRSLRELRQNHNVSNLEAENIQAFLRNVGLCEQSQSH